MTLITAPKEPAARLAWLVDREEIRALAHEFARSIDDKDQASYAATFSEDAELVLTFGTFHGRSAIEQMHPPVASMHTQHLIGQTVIELDGDTATARSYLLVTHGFDAADRSQKAQSGGWYDQRLVRTDDGWRFSRVEIVLVWVDSRSMRPDAPENRSGTAAQSA